MNWIKRLFCLIFGHYKILQLKKEKGLSNYYTVCCQCNKRWLNKQLSDKPLKLKTYSIKMVSHGQKIMIKSAIITKMQKKQKINFYVL